MTRWAFHNSILYTLVLFEVYTWVKLQLPRLSWILKPLSDYPIYNAIAPRVSIGSIGSAAHPVSVHIPAAHYKVFGQDTISDITMDSR